MLASAKGCEAQQRLSASPACCDGGVGVLSAECPPFCSHLKVLISPNERPLLVLNKKQKRPLREGDPCVTAKTKHHHLGLALQDFIKRR